MELKSEITDLNAEIAWMKFTSLLSGGGTLVLVLAALAFAIWG